MKTEVVIEVVELVFEAALKITKTVLKMEEELPKGGE